MQKLLLLVCLQTSTVLEGQLKEYDYNKNANVENAVLKPKDNTIGPKISDWNPKGSQSKTYNKPATKWRPGNKILGKKRSKATLPKMNEFSYRSGRDESAEVPTQKVTNKQKKKD